MKNRKKAILFNFSFESLSLPASEDGNKIRADKTNNKEWHNNQVSVISNSKQNKGKETGKQNQTGGKGENEVR